jgi:RNA polymerase subunit RPABC4/transcription elongation factor Spt4
MPSEYPPDWNSRRREVYKRDNYTCTHCGAKGGDEGNNELHAHHIVPKSRGGSHSTSNLITLCDQCHSAVHNKNSAARSPRQEDGLVRVQSDVFGEISDDIIIALPKILRFAVKKEWPDEITAELVRKRRNEISSSVLNVNNGLDKLDQLSPSSRYAEEVIEVDNRIINIWTETIQNILEKYEEMYKLLKEAEKSEVTCSECGAVLDTKADFCPECGAEVQTYPSCPGCNEMLDMDQNYCPGCGESLSEVEFSETAKKRKKAVEKFEEAVAAYQRNIEEFNKAMEKRNSMINGN